MTKSGGQFELLNWLEKSTRLLMLEDYDIVDFTIRSDGFKIEKKR